MLQHEITPFADQHIAEIKEIQEKMNSVIGASNMSQQQCRVLLDARDDLEHTIRALVRFKVCAEDEWKQKTRYEKYAKEHGYPFS